MGVCEQTLGSRKPTKLASVVQGGQTQLVIATPPRSCFGAESAHTGLGLLDFWELPWALASQTFLAFGALRCHGKWGVGNGYVLMGDHEQFYPEIALGWMAKLEEGWTISEELYHMTRWR